MSPCTKNRILLTKTIKGPVDLLALHQANPERYPHLLQSTSDGPQGRYDILFSFPGKTLSLDQAGNLHSDFSYANRSDEFLTSFDQCWFEQGKEQVCNSNDLPFTGGWFLYLGYELAGQIEPQLQLPHTADDLPTAFATRFSTALIYDRQNHCTTLVAESGLDQEIAAMQQDLRLANQPLAKAKEPVLLQLQEDEPQDYLNTVARALDYIHDGDIFQSNLSRQWRATLEPDSKSAALYRNLRAHNPGPFNGIACWKDSAIISSSPERLVQSVKGILETRPIAGTYPRGKNHVEDNALLNEMVAHPKERAEHIMLIDLERNDLGRVCEPGSIQVNELMTVESYAHVHHIASNVRGQLRSGITPGQVISAVFPGGTITGCPKVRCMEIIAELEQVSRGAYTGSMGYVNHNGDMDLNILIRTMVHKKGRLTLRAGAGIVADSIPERELEETRHKARGLLLALTSQQTHNKQAV